MDIDSIARELSGLAPEQISSLKPIMKALAGLATKHRENHSGLVPLDVFPFCTEIGGSHPVIELAIRNKGGEYALKLREVSDQGWSGQYHIPGTVIRTTDSWHEVLTRLCNESLDSWSVSNWYQFKVATMDLDFQKERMAMSLHVVLLWEVMEFPAFKGGIDTWKIISVEELAEMSLPDKHRKTLHALDRLPPDELRSFHSHIFE